MQFSISTSCLGGPLERRLEAASAAGFQGVELFYDDCKNSGLSMRAIGDIIRNLGLYAESLQPVRGYEGDRSDVFTESRSRALRLIEDAVAIGANKVGICANEKDSNFNINDTIDVFHDLADIAQDCELLLSLEALTWSTHIRDLATAWNIVSRVDRQNFGLTLDSFHIGARGNDPTLISTIPSKKIFALQLSSLAVPENDSWINLSRHHRCLPHEGRFPVDAIVIAALETGYEGSVTIEIFNDEFLKSDPEKIAKDCYESLMKVIDRNSNLLR